MSDNVFGIWITMKFASTGAVKGGKKNEGSTQSLFHQNFNKHNAVGFFQNFVTGAGALRIGKISNKTRILGNFSFQ